MPLPYNTGFSVLIHTVHLLGEIPSFWVLNVCQAMIEEESGLRDPEYRTQINMENDMHFVLITTLFAISKYWKQLICP